MELVSQKLQRIHVRALAVEMNRKHRAQLVTAAAAKKRFHLSGIEIEGARIDIGKQWTRSGARDCAGRGEKAERCGENEISRLHACGGQSQPQSVSAGGATHGIRRAAELRQFVFEGLDLRPQDVVLRSPQ